MINKNEAQEIAKKYLIAVDVINADIEFSKNDYQHVYVFYYKEKTNNLRKTDEKFILGGPGPQLIDKQSGIIISYGSGDSEKSAVNEYYLSKNYEPIIKENNNNNYDQKIMSKSEIQDFIFEKMKK